MGDGTEKRKRRKKSVKTVPIVIGTETAVFMSFEWWPALVIGWPGPTIAVVLSIIGVVKSNRAWLHAAAALLVPSSVYLIIASPRTQWLSLLPLVPLLGGAAISRGWILLGWISVLVLFAVVFWLVMIVSGTP